MGGTVAPGFEAVTRQFERNLSQRGDHGAAFAALVDGRPVVDLWGGLAARNPPRAWRRDTVAGIFSGSKALVASCLLLLIERGQLELDAPVHRYWPEFAAQGKDRILIRHVVSHRAGLPGLVTAVTAREATDAVRMAQLLAAQPALHAPGARLHYHALTFGWLCGELIRRVDGRSAGRFLREEIAGPLQLDAWIGLPREHEHRVATLDQDEAHGAPATAAGDGVGWATWENPPRFGDPLPANSRYWRAAEVPASNGVASARSLARLFACLARGGELDGVRLLRPQTVELGVRCLAAGVEPFLQTPMSFGIGFQLQTKVAPFGPPAVAYGHTGSGGSVHGAWPERAVGFSYVTNTLRHSDGADPRAAALLQALHAALTTTSPDTHREQETATR